MILIDLLILLIELLILLSELLLFLVDYFLLFLKFFLCFTQELFEFCIFHLVLFLIFWRFILINLFKITSILIIFSAFVFFWDLILLWFRTLSFLMILNSYFSFQVRILYFLIILYHLLEIFIPFLPALLNHALTLSFDILDAFFYESNSMERYFL